MLCLGLKHTFPVPPTLPGEYQPSLTTGWPSEWPSPGVWVLGTYLCSIPNYLLCSLGLLVLLLFSEKVLRRPQVYVLWEGGHCQESRKIWALISLALPSTQECAPNLWLFGYMALLPKGLSPVHFHSLSMQQCAICSIHVCWMNGEFLSAWNVTIRG